MAKLGVRGMAIRRVRSAVEASSLPTFTVTSMGRRIFVSSAHPRSNFCNHVGRMAVGNRGHRRGLEFPTAFAAPDDVPVFICEGEKDADNVAALGLIATTNSGGAGKWPREINKWFVGKHPAYVLEDNDPPDNPKGQQHAREVADHLRSFVDDVRVVSFPELPPKGDVSEFFARGGTAEQLLARAKAGRGPVRIHGFDPSDWAGDPEPEPLKEIVPGYIIDETTTMFSGDGGTGKSYLAHQLSAARALERKWIGLGVTPGKTLFLSCEDNLAEMKRRLYWIVQTYDAGWSDLKGRVRLVDLVGEDSILAMTKKGIVEAAPMYHALDEYMQEFGPGLTILDVLAALFAGNEIIRTEVRQFANLLNGLCKKHKSAILLLAHPSLAGMSSGTGLSGSTDWNNGFRSRCYLETISGKDTIPYRVFKGMKKNYGELGGKINLEWRNGLYVPVKEEAKVEKVINEAKIEEKFMASLQRAQHRSWSTMLLPCQ
jgi:hypothetical protein